MLDIKFIREHADIVRKDLKKRKQLDKLPWVDEVLEKDGKWRKLKQEIDVLRHSRNTITQEISVLKKAGQDIKAKLADAQSIPDKIKTHEEELAKLDERIHYILMRLPNILHESVPVGKDDTGNVEVRKWGAIRKFDFELPPHGEMLEQKGLAEFKRAAKVSGAGFYYLKGDLALLEMALSRYAVDFIISKGFTLIQPPFLLGREAYEGVTDLSDFENVMYKIEGSDLYLIATSEHPIGAMHMNEVIEDKDLPLRYCGISACFRKEIGSHGVDTRGIFRVHQFNKIEQFVFCKPEDSWKIHEEILANAEQLFQMLNLPYRVVNICTGDMGTVAAKKYDLEAWMPRENAYREVVSCSNCTSYQAVRLNAKYDKGDSKEYLHTLNSTAVATARTLRAIIENNANKDGSFNVPEVLVPYMNGKKKIG